MKYFYSSASQGFFGEGYAWHKPILLTESIRRFIKRERTLTQDGFSFCTIPKFPDFPFVCKTITLNPKKGTPWRFTPPPITMITRSCWNKIRLHNKGFDWFIKEYTWRFASGEKCGDLYKLIPSLYGTTDELQRMIDGLEEYLDYMIKMVEINVSCPNVKEIAEIKLPESPYPLSLKLRYDDDPRRYDLSNVKRITLNSIPASRYIKGMPGGISGKLAQSRNWDFIRKYQIQIAPEIAGCSITKMEDIETLSKPPYNCKSIGLGSVLMINPWLVLKLKEER